MSDRRSVAFDRAAEYYDATRGFAPETEAAMTALLTDEFGGRGRVLEIGVGTGQVALPLSASGVPLAGIDLALPMMDRLVTKAGGRSPFPLVQGDAIRMPFADDAFGGAYLRWVLHLIPAWEAALAETLRVVRPGGVLAVSLGSYGGPRSEIQDRFKELIGLSLEPVGLTWDGYEPLDEAMRSFGATARALPSLFDPERESLATFIDGIANNRYSWTWSIEDGDLLARAANEVRTWAEERFGELGRRREGTYEVTWRAYDLPA